MDLRSFLAGSLKDITRSIDNVVQAAVEIMGLFHLGLDDVLWSSDVEVQDLGAGLSESGKRRGATSSGDDMMASAEGFHRDALAKAAATTSNEPDGDLGSHVKVSQLRLRVL